MADGSLGSTEIPSPDFKFPAKYTELTGEAQGNGWSTERLLSEYVRNTDGIIGKLDGSIPLKDDKGEILGPPTSVIYLDKSARPVQWMVSALWPILAKKEGGNIAPKPQQYFLNIDKDMWLVDMGFNPGEIQDASSKPINLNNIENIQDHINRIRAIYSKEPLEEENVGDAFNYPTRLDGQHVLVIDEVKSSGKTLEIAQMLLSRAIP